MVDVYRTLHARLRRNGLAAMVALIAMLVMAQSVAGRQDDVAKVIRQLNDHATVKGTDDTKSFKILFDAYLQLTPPPTPVGDEFNLNTIHPKMSNWPAVSGWAESNAKMAEAILKCREKNILGLPYGAANVDAKYREKGVLADIAVNGVLRDNRFPYIEAVREIAAFSTAEVYRLMEGGKVQEGLDLGMAMIFVLRQMCDREFLNEKLPSIELLSDSLSNYRDVFYLYREKVTPAQFRKVAFEDIPFLRPDRGRLFIPEGDRVVAEAIIRDVFDNASAEADPDKFTQAFASIQAQQEPLTRFGAARRWRMIAQIHGSIDASLERLKRIYDDWWRRWRVQEYDPILEIPTEFERTNPIRYAAVIYAMQNMQAIFAARNQLVIEVNGTAMAAGLCAYRQTFNTYPDISVKTYAQFARKRSDIDPYDFTFGPMQYSQLSSRQSIDTPEGRLWVESGEALLWSIGQDHEDGRAVQHSDDGADGDIVVWPPIKSLQRAQGLIQ